MRAERLENQRPWIKEIEADNSSSLEMDLLVEDDGDVIMSVRDKRDPKSELVLHFNTSQGGSNHAFISKEFRRLAELLYLEKKDPEKLSEVLTKESINLLITG